MNKAKIPKFRAWQKYHKRMLKVKGIEFNKDVNIEAITVWNPLNTIPFTNTYIKDADFDIEALILMQSTGLKDKNGVEIYEGDVVKGYSVYPTASTFESFLMGEVYYTNRGTWDCYSYILGGFNEQVEVIGNIYENPLAKESK